MEQSAFEAVMIGVNVFVFIIALTAAIMLMSSVIDMVNFANELTIVGMNGTIAQNVGDVHERIYTGSQMLTYYREQIESQEQDKSEGKYLFSVRRHENGQETPLDEYIQQNVNSGYLKEEYILQYKGIIQGKYAYVFSLKQ